MAQAQAADLRLQGVIKSRAAARISARQRGGGAVFGRQQRQLQQRAARHGNAIGQQAAALQGRTTISAHDAYLLIMILPRVEHHHGRHQLGDRGDGHDGVRVFRHQYLAAGVIEHQHVFGADGQVQHAGGGFGQGRPADGRLALRLQQQGGAGQQQGGHGHLPAAGVKTRHHQSFDTREQRPAPGRHQ
ncbi:hypothetical protein D3C72_1213970 [compost metagenome]